MRGGTVSHAEPSGETESRTEARRSGRAVAAGTNHTLTMGSASAVALDGVRLSLLRCTPVPARPGAGAFQPTLRALFATPTASPISASTESSLGRAMGHGQERIGDDSRARPRANATRPRKNGLYGRDSIHGTMCRFETPIDCFGECWPTRGLRAALGPRGLRGRRGRRQHRDWRCRRQCGQWRKRRDELRWIGGRGWSHGWVRWRRRV